MRSGRPVDKENDTPARAEHRRRYAVRMKARRANMPTVAHSPQNRTKSYQTRLTLATEAFLKLNAPLGSHRREVSNGE
jgi:hypothetical protein